MAQQSPTLARLCLPLTSLQQLSRLLPPVNRSSALALASPCPSLPGTPGSPPSHGCWHPLVSHTSPWEWPLLAVLFGVSASCESWTTPCLFPSSLAPDVHHSLWVSVSSMSIATAQPGHLIFLPFYPPCPVWCPGQVRHSATICRILFIFYLKAACVCTVFVEKSQNL